MSAFEFDGFQFQDGDLLFCRGGSNIIGPVIRNSEGDFDFEHVCSFWTINDKPMILTTGAAFDWKKVAFIYGMVPAAEYLKTRSYAVGRRTDLNWVQQEMRLATLRRLADRRAPYAVAKVVKLATKGRTSAGVVNQINAIPDLKPLKLFCAEAEAYGIGEALIPSMGVKAALRQINSKYPNKSEYCVHTPETLYDSPATEILHRVDR